MPSSDACATVDEALAWLRHEAFAPRGLPMPVMHGLSMDTGAPRD